jgi:hypothetical protein
MLLVILNHQSKGVAKSKFLIAFLTMEVGRYLHKTEDENRSRRRSYSIMPCSKECAE